MERHGAAIIERPALEVIPMGTLREGRFGVRDRIASVGPGGSYMGRNHTKARMKTTAVLPRLANREMRAQWEEAGKPSIHERAMDEARRILAQPNGAVWDAALDTAIRERFPGLVAGDAKPLEG